jgi:hypothetical protein
MIKISIYAAPNFRIMAYRTMETVFAPFWREFSAIEMANEYGNENIGNSFDVSLGIYKLCADLCRLYKSFQVLNMDEGIRCSADILAHIFQIKCSKSDELSLRLELDHGLDKVKAKTDIAILDHIQNLQKIMLEHKINFGTGAIGPPYPRFTCDLFCNYALADEMYSILQYIHLHTNKSLTQLALIRLETRYPLIYARNREEGKGLFNLCNYETFQ